MKKLSILFFVMVFSGALLAQSPSFTKGIAVKKLFLDFESQNGGSFTDFESYKHGFELGISTRLTKNINLYVPGKFGVVKDSITGKTKTILGADAVLQYFFYNEKSNFVPYIMGGVGLMQVYNGDKDMMVPIGAGINFKVAERAFINVQSEYRVSLDLKKDVLHHGIGIVYMFGKAKEKEPKDIDTGFLDSDNDGVRDDIDLCPQVKGSPALNGCPDTDGDGVADYKDACPDVKGLAELKGCPDSDGDGIPDNEDECPNLAGIKMLKGCPDTKIIKDRDGDGIADNMDKCPDQAGPVNTEGCPDRDNDGVSDLEDKCPGVAGSIASKGCPDRDGDGIADNVDRCPDKAGYPMYGGCPEAAKEADRDNDGVADVRDKCPDQAGLSIYQGCPDTDGDGLDDFNDRCPSMAGPIENKGCPKISVEDKKTLDVAMRSVQFDLGKSSLKPVSYRILNQVAKIMEKYQDYNLVISGHTDNTGSASKNQKLSAERAKSCYNYLVAQGIEESRMSHVGYGESRPIANNKTLKGRSLNRRVEFSLIPAK